MSDEIPTPARDLRSALMDAALALMTETGAWSFSLREVARRANVSHNAPYRHFSDKGALLTAIGTAGYDALRRALDQAVGCESDAVDGLRALAKAFVGFALEDRARYRLMVGKEVRQADGGIAPELRHAADGSRQVLRMLLIRGGRDGVFAVNANDPDDLSAAVVTIWSLLHGFTLLELDHLRYLETSIGMDMLTDQVSDRLVRSICPVLPAAKPAECAAHVKVSADEDALKSSLL